MLFYSISTHPVFTGLAVQVYEQLTNLKLIKMMKNSAIAPNTSNQLGDSPKENLKDALWNAFLVSVQHVTTFN